jgi:hypothetical protein
VEKNKGHATRKIGDNVSQPFLEGAMGCRGLPESDNRADISLNDICQSWVVFF